MVRTGILTLACAALLMGHGATALAEAVEGELRWADQRRLGLAVAGVIEAVDARAGARVEAGTELLRLDPRPFLARRALAEARLQSVAPATEEAEAEFERAQDLLDRTVISEADYRVAEIAVAQARARLSAARSAVELADWALARSRLLADRPSRVLAVGASPGQVVDNAGGVQMLLELADAERLDAVAVVTRRQLGQVGPGSRVEVRLGRRVIAGEVWAVEPEGRAPGDRWRLTVRFPYDSVQLPEPGQPLRIELP